MTRLLIVIVAAGAALLAGCTPPAQPTQTSSATTQAAPLTPSGPAATIGPQTGNELQDAASVVQLNNLAHQGNLAVKLFATAGGDPAMNGLQTYLAFYVGPAEGFTIFQVGNILDYRVLSDTPGRVDLEIRENTMNESTNEIGTQTRRIIVSWTSASADEAPTSVSVTPAQ